MGQLEVVRLLLSSGADVNAINNTSDRDTAKADLQFNPAEHEASLTPDMLAELTKYSAEKQKPIIDFVALDTRDSGGKGATKLFLALKRA